MIKLKYWGIYGEQVKPDQIIRHQIAHGNRGLWILNCLFNKMKNFSAWAMYGITCSATGHGWANTAALGSLSWQQRAVPWEDWEECHSAHSEHSPMGWWYGHFQLQTAVPGRKDTERSGVQSYPRPSCPNLPKHPAKVSGEERVIPQTLSSQTLGVINGLGFLCWRRSSRRGLAV